MARKRVTTIAAELIAAREGRIPACLVLGAGASLSAGVPLWEDFAERVLNELDVDDAEDRQPSTSTQQLERHLTENPMGHDLVASCIEAVLSGAQTTRGYRFLAEVVRQGFYNTIITTNWDSLLETALAHVMRADEFLVLNRDSAPDHYLAKTIAASGRRRVVILKLHGDPKSRLRTGEGLTTRSIDHELLDALSGRLEKVHIVGHSVSDVDVIQLLARSIGDSEMTVVDPRPTKLNATVKTLTDHIVGGETSLATLRYGRKHAALPTDATGKINVGEFDHFFCQLALALERKAIAGQQHRMREVESAILKKEETGLRYINYSQISRLTQKFLAELRAEGAPDIVFFVNDPTAPGGMELKKRIENELEHEGVAVGVIRIEGASGNRSFERQFRGPDSPDVHPDSTKVRSVHVVDSITFSGNTLNIARDQVRMWYPHAEVKIGALVVSQLLIDEGQSDQTREIYHASVTDRFEIFFPWGVTQTTAGFNRRFLALDGERLVHIARRPWGAIEVLADEEPCSVRLLTIEANRRLSFQRHLCRDELFVALDDNIGLDLSVADLTAGDDAFHPSVKSMVLEKGDYVLIPRGVWHRTKASMDRVRLLEVGFGVYEQQYDIERLADDFDRVKDDGAQ